MTHTVSRTHDTLAHVLDAQGRRVSRHDVISDADKEAERLNNHGGDARKEIGMKFTVTMKDPDTLYDAVSDAVEKAVAEIPGLDAGEREAVEEERRETIRSITGAWFRYGEYVSIEIDTEAKTATVLRVQP